MFKRIMVANDGSDGGYKAFAFACDLAKFHRAGLSMVSVEELPNFPASIDEIIETKAVENHKFHGVLTKARATAKRKKIKLEAEVLAGHAASAIVAHAKRSKADLLVVGFTGHSALYEHLIGGTADRIVRLAPCPVLVVK